MHAIQNIIEFKYSSNFQQSDEMELIAAYRKLFRVAIIIFHRVHIAGGFLRAEYVRRRGSREFS